MSDSNPTEKTAIDLDVGLHRVTFLPSHWPAIQEAVNAAMAAPDTGFHSANHRTRVRAKARTIGLYSPLRKREKED